MARDTNVQLIIIDLNIKIDTAVEAAVVGLTAGKIVVVRPTAVRKQEDYPGKLWKNSHIIVANDYEAPILLGTCTLTAVITGIPLSFCASLSPASCVVRPPIP